ncbi:hypothetical protein KO481_24015 [Nocardia sp. NEAU-G5]|uniref:Uncharacterized protein n=1 Tax=Nocardia albiluteola TaxID=2842303 RepID=A0ABS6B5G5_9NOCA|nr:hypothetical protein [Nocardia albiluteola]MBU3064585.1 hypothetical protein [Nocardia albiluteola]
MQGLSPATQDLLSVNGIRALGEQASTHHHVEHDPDPGVPFLNVQGKLLAQVFGGGRTDEES